MSRKTWRDELGRLVDPEMITLVNEERGCSLRAYVADGRAWFLAADVRALLGTTSDRGSKARLRADERSSIVMNTDGGRQVMLTVSEVGLHVMLAYSRRPEVPDVLRWVLLDVLPAIRKSRT